MSSSGLKQAVDCVCTWVSGLLNTSHPLPHHSSLSQDAFHHHHEMDLDHQMHAALALEQAR